MSSNRQKNHSRLRDVLKGLSATGFMAIQPKVHDIFFMGNNRQVGASIEMQVYGPKVRYAVLVCNEEGGFAEHLARGRDYEDFLDAFKSRNDQTNDPGERYYFHSREVTEMIIREQTADRGIVFAGKLYVETDFKGNIRMTAFVRRCKGCMDTRYAQFVKKHGIRIKSSPNLKD